MVILLKNTVQLQADLEVLASGHQYSVVPFSNVVTSFLILVFLPGTLLNPKRNY